VVEIATHHHLLAHHQVFSNIGTALLQTEERTSGSSQYVFHLQIFVSPGGPEPAG
jgi:hypothetical protein